MLLFACNDNSSLQNNSMSKSVTTYVYVVNSGNNSYTKCVVSESNTWSRCGTVFIDNFIKPTGIGFHSNYAYVINNNDNSYVRCSILSDGTLDDCKKKNSDLLNKPLKIAFDGDFAYIINDESSVYTKCLIGKQGFLDNCRNSSIDVDHTFNVLSDIGFQGNNAYITNATGGYYQCSVNSSGDLTACILHPSGLLHLPSSIAFNNNHTYITYIGIRSHYTECEINQSSGDLRCQVPMLIDSSVPTDIVFNNDTAYILSCEDNSYIKCSVDSSGLLSNCNKSIIRGFNHPFSEGFYSIDTSKSFSNTRL